MVVSPKIPNIREGFVRITDEPGRYSITQAGPFSYWGESYLTAKESSHYNEWFEQHLTPIPLYESPPKHLMKYKGEVFKLLLYPLDDEDSSYVDDVVFGNTISIKMPTR